MTSGLVGAELDRQRERWLLARRELNLVDATGVDFAAAGRARKVKDLAVRILILPADPLAHLYDIDASFSERWPRLNIDPALNREGRWGNATRADAGGFVNCELDGERWHRYLALNYSGAVDVGLGRGYARDSQSGRAFNLIGIVGRLWAAVAVAARHADAVKASGPWEVSLGLVGTEGSTLNGFAQSWDNQWDDGASLSGPNLLLRRECESLAGDVPREIAFSLGAQIENAFGSIVQRFRLWGGKTPGEFDGARYARFI